MAKAAIYAQVSQIWSSQSNSRSLPPSPLSSRLSCSPLISRPRVSSLHHGHPPECDTHRDTHPDIHTYMYPHTQTHRHTYPGLPAADVTPTSGSRPVCHSYQDSIVEQVIFKIMLGCCCDWPSESKTTEEERVSEGDDHSLCVHSTTTSSSSTSTSTSKQASTSNPHAYITDPDHVRPVVWGFSHVSLSTFHMYLLHLLVSITS